MGMTIVRLGRPEADRRTAPGLRHRPLHPHGQPGRSILMRLFRRRPDRDGFTRRCHGQPQGDHGVRRVSVTATRPCYLEDR